VETPSSDAPLEKLAESVEPSSVPQISAAPVSVVADPVNLLSDADVTPEDEAKVLDFLGYSAPTGQPENFDDVFENI
jgi:hypothetical protein